MKSSTKLRWGMAATILMASMLMGQNYSARADQYFPQTRANIWGPFEVYWQSHGGLAQFGMPRTGVFAAGEGYDAQWFERALFTYNPRNPDPHKVELQLLGASSTVDRRSEAPFQAAEDSKQGLFFDATSHNLSGKFLDHWRATGGLPIYGYPISEPFQERSKSDGNMYTVQYFERNRFELHPELAGTPFEVQLGLLGSEMLDAQGGPEAFSNKGQAAFYPPPTKASVPPTGNVPAAPTLPTTSAQVLFQDDFSSTDMNAWRAMAPLAPADVRPAQWRANNGMLEQWSNHHEENTDTDAVLVTAAQSFDNFTLDAHLYATSGEPVGAVVRYSRDGFYLLKLYGRVANNAPKAELLKVANDRTTLVANSQSWPGYSYGAWHRLTVTAQGNNLMVQIDGQTAIQTKDATFTKGSIGLYAYADGTARFDNVRVVAAPSLLRNFIR